MSLAAIAREIATHGEIPNGSPRMSSEDGLDAEKSTQHSHGQGFPKSVLDTPSTRTGPPRSLSFAYSLPGSPPRTRDNSKYVENDSNIPYATEEDSYFSPAPGSVFRGALEHGTPSEHSDKKGKKRESRNMEEVWNFMRWFQESPKTSPKDEKPSFTFPTSNTESVHNVPVSTPASPTDSPRVEDKETRHHHKTLTNDERTNSILPKFGLKRSSSVPGNSSEHKQGRAKWGRLKSLLPHIVSHGQGDAPAEPANAVVNNQVNITDELITGGLSALMLRLWFERDEKDHRRVPVLLHRLRIRISDSLHPMHGNKAVFRIECEYANGAARWVVYRELRDFFSLHAHYVASNAYNRNVDNMPEFPRTSLPYFRLLKKEGRDIGQADFARLQRESLENYLLDLIRAVMFHPSANRLSGFLEINALSIALAQSGGAQYKAGILQIISGNGTAFGRKSAGRIAKRIPRWCAVRESYLVVLEEPGETTIWDVFLLDPDFEIWRPPRYYRQGLKLLHVHEDHDHDDSRASPHRLQVHPESDKKSLMGSIRSRLSGVFHHRHGRDRNTTTNGHIEEDSDDDSSASLPTRPATPMLDPSTNVNPIVVPNANSAKSGQENDEKKKKRKNPKDVSKHTFYIKNSQGKLKLSARNERQMLQWITALEKVAATSHYAGKNRFESFAPIRLNVAAQWLVDGRDYFWNLSRAILMAKESIYIHDWWLTPELQMRRPDKGRYRLDRLLEAKAKEGVKIHIILYQEVSNRTTPTDSNYAKQRLLTLHPNVMVQRSPSHFQTGTFYWAHHEKVCVIDQTIAFMGGLDLCFGRWDTAQHVLTDDMEGTDRSEIWPGKDYSNPRISDFYNLHKPEEDMYDRSKVPRMPWHDVAMQVVGQPARDLARHFVQRWNYLLRIKNHSRVYPFLLPPPEFRPGELTQLGLTGTCEMQICRSAGPWSLGTPEKIEHSIQNAYLKAIQMSEHFVYIENQFFITSTVVNDVKVENQIGDAIVHRIIRAHRDGTPWKCCIVIPLLPGFTFPVDHSDASAIRIILECQNRTISRGPNSIFARLRKEGIDPDDYIAVFSLRNWAKLRGDVLTTEQVYIHGKVCIVDDRLAIIGSANINERSQRGDRDSELAAVIRDTDMIDCTMAGKPFKVGRFAHTLRVRLMREHLGIDVDSLHEDDLMSNQPAEPEYAENAWDPSSEQTYGVEEGVTHLKKNKQRSGMQNLLHTTGDGLQQALHATGEATSKSTTKNLQRAGLAKGSVAQTAGDNTMDEERKMFTRDGQEVPGFASAVVPTLEEKVVAEHLDEIESNPGSDEEAGQNQEVASSEHYPNGLSTPADSRADGVDAKAKTVDETLMGAPANAQKSARTDDEPPHAPEAPNDADEQEKHAPEARSTIRRRLTSKTWAPAAPRPKVKVDGFEDPVSEAFWKNVWVASAVFNTEIFRRVFHAVPDDLVTTWKQYKEFIIHHERLNKPVKDTTKPDPVARVPSEAGDENVPADNNAELPSDDDTPSNKDGDGAGHPSTPNEPTGVADKEPKLRRQSGAAEPFEKWERDEMEKLLTQLNGHLVLYPTRFLEGEDIANNFLFNADRMLPLPIYD